MKCAYPDCQCEDLNINSGLCSEHEALRQEIAGNAWISHITWFQYLVDKREKRRTNAQQTGTE